MTFANLYPSFALESNLPQQSIDFTIGCKRKYKPNENINTVTMLSSYRSPSDSPERKMQKLGRNGKENEAPKLDVHYVLTNLTTPPKRNITTKKIDKYTLDIATPNSVITPKRKIVDNPTEDWPNCFIEFKRNLDGSANITCPEKWKNLGHLVYIAISDDGRILVGRTDDLEKRLAGYQKELTDGKRSLGEAWTQGKQVFIAPLHLCSSYETARQNETSYIVAKRAKHNRNRGNGDPTIDFGSPLKNGGGGRLREDHLKPLAEEYRNTLKPITDLKHAEPKKWCQLRYNKEDDYIEVDIPTEWRTLQSALYVIKVVEKQYIGETAMFGPRISIHLSNTNGHATNSNQKLPKAIRQALRQNLYVAIGILGVCNPTKLENRKVLERAAIIARNTSISQGGLNSRLDGPDKAPTSPLYALPSPKKQTHTATIRSLRKLKCQLFTREDAIAKPEKGQERMDDDEWLNSPSSTLSSDMSSPDDR